MTDAAGNETNVYDRGVLTPPYEDYLSEREIDLSSVDNATKVTITFDGGLRDAVLDNLVWENAHPPNTAPTFTAGPSASLTVDEDAAATSIASQLEVDDPDDGQTLTWSVASGPSHGTLSGFSATAAGGTAIEPSGVTYTPNADYSGSDSFDIQVSNGTDTDVVTVDVTVTAVPDLTITDGTASNLDFPPDVEPGTDDNPVGIFALSGGQSGALFEGVTITNTAPGVAGISVARLYWSDDQTLEPGSDTELGAVTTDASSAPSTVSFSGFSEPIPTSARYAILAIDVTDEASDSGVQFELSEPSDLSVPGGEVAVVNGSAQDSFAGLLLSNESAALPVEMAGFDAEVSGGESVNLQWQTASEMNNAGFYVERKRDDDSWSEVGFVESQADGGTTTEVQSYRFVDADVPFAADSLAYRLRQVDTDGTASYTEPVTVARSTVEQVRLLGTFPNPARSRATVRLAVPEGTEGDVRLRLYDVLGRAVRTVGVPAEVGRHALTLETAGLPSGTYFLRLAAGAVTQTKQVTVVQ